MQVSNVLVDGHVHIYEAAHCDAILDAGSANFRAAAERQHIQPDYGVLLLADPVGVDGFGWFGALDGDPSSAERKSTWTLVARPDADTLHFHKPGALPLLIISGHQAITSENLEVLIFPKIALETMRRPLSETLDAAAAADALTVVPWGAGKWMGRRGRIIGQMLDKSQSDNLSVADNGGRPVFPRRVRLLELAREKGFAEISGTDPLPLSNEERRVGAYGVRLELAIDTQSTAHDIIRALRQKTLVPMGKRLPLHQFLSKQVALRLR